MCLYYLKPISIFPDKGFSVILKKSLAFSCAFSYFDINAAATKHLRQNNISQKTLNNLLENFIAKV